MVCLTKLKRVGLSFEIARCRGDRSTTSDVLASTVPELSIMEEVVIHSNQSEPRKASRGVVSCLRAGDFQESMVFTDPRWRMDSMLSEGSSQVPGLLDKETTGS